MLLGESVVLVKSECSKSGILGMKNLLERLDYLKDWNLWLEVAIDGITNNG